MKWFTWESLFLLYRNLFQCSSETTHIVVRHWWMQTFVDVCPHWKATFSWRHSQTKTEQLGNVCPVFNRVPWALTCPLSLCHEIQTCLVRCSLPLQIGISHQNGILAYFHLPHLCKIVVESSECLISCGAKIVDRQEIVGIKKKSILNLFCKVCFSCSDLLH